MRQAQGGREPGGHVTKSRGGVCRNRPQIQGQSDLQSPERAALALPFGLFPAQGPASINPQPLSASPVLEKSSQKEIPPLQMETVMSRVGQGSPQGPLKDRDLPSRAQLHPGPSNALVPILGGGCGQ